jgi:hypothetical protein
LALRLLKQIEGDYSKGIENMSDTNTGQSNRLSPEEIAEQASKPDHDQIYRQPLRGDETKGDPDDRDVAGAPDYEETPHGREERKHQIEKEAEKNDR